MHCYLFRLLGLIFDRNLGSCVASVLQNEANYIVRSFYVGRLVTLKLRKKLFAISTVFLFKIQVLLSGAVQWINLNHIQERVRPTLVT
jgi:hypothetical protein